MQSLNLNGALNSILRPPTPLNVVSFTAAVTVYIIISISNDDDNVNVNDNGSSSNGSSDGSRRDDHSW